MVVSWLRHFVVNVLMLRPTVGSGPVRVAFAMDPVALGQILLRVLRIYCHCISITATHTLIFHSSTSDDI